MRGNTVFVGVCVILLQLVRDKLSPYLHHSFFKSEETVDLNNISILQMVLALCMFYFVLEC